MEEIEIGPEVDDQHEHAVAHTRQVADSRPVAETTPGPAQQGAHSEDEEVENSERGILARR